MEPNVVLVSKINESYIRLVCEDSIKEELSQYFTFDVPGASYSPQYRAKRWDGKIRLFNKGTRRLYAGLLQHLMIFCQDREYLLTWDNSSKDMDIEDEFSVYHAEKFVANLQLTSKGKEITPHQHQMDAFRHAMQARRALILSPTASGKSLVIYLLFRQLLDYQGLKGLLIVPTTSLVEQMYADFKDYASKDTKFDTEFNVHRIYEGHEKESRKALFVSTWQSLQDMPAEYFRQFDYVIGDEAHLCKAASLTHIISSCTNAKYRIGLTGSLDGIKVNKLIIEGLLGPERKVATTKDLIDRGLISKLTINCLVLRHSDANVASIKGATYENEIQFLIGSEQRNKFIKNLAISLKNNTLVLYARVEKHGQILYDMISQSEKIGNRNVYFVHGGVEADDREIIRKIVETQNDAIIVASYGTFSTGININNLHNLILASSTKSVVRVMQSTGRSLRLAEGKDIATLYDISDDLRSGKWDNHTLKHFEHRLKIYASEKHPFKIYKIRIK